VDIDKDLMELDLRLQKYYADFKKEIESAEFVNSLPDSVVEVKLISWEAKSLSPHFGGDKGKYSDTPKLETIINKWTTE